MGGAAISTLAGAMLISYDGKPQFIRETIPFIRGLTLAFWVLATAWIPLLASLEIWRYVYKRSPIFYNYQQWNMVFPLGMYCACTIAARSHYRF